MNTGEVVGVCFLQPMVTFIMSSIILPSHVTPTYSNICVHTALWGLCTDSYNTNEDLRLYGLCCTLCPTL